MSLLESASEIADRFEIDQVHLLTQTVRGWLLARRGRAAEGVAHARAAIDRTKLFRMRYLLTWQFPWLAEALLIQGDTAATLQTVAEALDISDRMGVRAFDADCFDCAEKRSSEVANMIAARSPSARAWSWRQLKGRGRLPFDVR